MKIYLKRNFKGLWNEAEHTGKGGKLFILLLRADLRSTGICFCRWVSRATLLPLSLEVLLWRLTAAGALGTGTGMGAGALGGSGTATGTGAGVGGGEGVAGTGSGCFAP